MNANTTPQQPIFALEKMYVQDLSLEIPNAPAIFLEQDAPSIGFTMSTRAEALGGDRYEVVVMGTVTATLKEKTVFLIEVKQAGIFQIANLAREDLEHALAVGCPNIIYPYLRQTITDISVRAGFMPVLLGTINFDTLYQQQKHQSEPRQDQVSGMTH